MKAFLRGVASRIPNYAAGLAIIYAFTDGWRAAACALVVLGWGIWTARRFYVLARDYRVAQVEEFVLRDVDRLLRAEAQSWTDGDHPQREERAWRYEMAAAFLRRERQHAEADGRTFAQQAHARRGVLITTPTEET